MIRIVFAALAGLVFGVGLTVSQMINPERVLGFFDLFRTWDPTLAFVMTGALAVAVPGYWLVAKKDGPVASDMFHVPTRNDIDTKLVIGSAIFGCGWAIAGLCPGPAFAGLALMKSESLIYVAAMAAGLAAGVVYNRRAS